MVYGHHHLVGDTSLTPFVSHYTVVSYTSLHCSFPSASVGEDPRAHQKRPVRGKMKCIDDVYSIAIAQEAPWVGESKKIEDSDLKVEVKDSCVLVLRH